MWSSCNFNLSMCNELQRPNPPPTTHYSKGARRPTSRCANQLSLYLMPSLKMVSVLASPLRDPHQLSLYLSLYSTIATKWMYRNNYVIPNREMILWHHGVKQWFHTTTKRQTGYSRLTIPNSTILISKHPFFWNLHSLSSSPRNLSPPPLIFYSSSALSTWSHGLNFHSLPSTLSPPNVFPLLKFCSSKALSLRLGWCLKAWGVGVSLMFERVDFKSDLSLKIWVLFGFGNGFRFDVWNWGLIVFVRVWK